MVLITPHWRRIHNSKTNFTGMDQSVCILAQILMWSPQMVWKITSRRWDLRLDVSPPIGAGISVQRWDLHLEVAPLIGGGTSNWRWDLLLEVGPPIGSEIFYWRWDIQLEVRSKQGVGTTIRWLGHTCSDTQGHPTSHVTIHRGWTRHGL